jgi:hypothetical protein
MVILREAMMVESKPGHIELTVSRKVRPGTQPVTSVPVVTSSPAKPPTAGSIVKIIENGQTVTTASNSSRFNRDAPARRSMSEKRTKLGHIPAQFVQSLTSSAINKVCFLFCCCCGGEFCQNSHSTLHI